MGSRERYTTGSGRAAKLGEAGEGHVGKGCVGRAIKVDGEHGRLAKLVRKFISSLWPLLRLKTIICDNIHLHGVSDTFQQQQGVESKEADG